MDIRILTTLLIAFAAGVNPPAALLLVGLIARFGPLHLAPPLAGVLTAPFCLACLALVAVLDLGRERLGRATALVGVARAGMALAGGATLAAALVASFEHWLPGGPGTAGLLVAVTGAAVALAGHMVRAALGAVAALDFAPWLASFEALVSLLLVGMALVAPWWSLAVVPLAVLVGAVAGLQIYRLARRMLSPSLQAARARALPAVTGAGATARPGNGPRRSGSSGTPRGVTVGGRPPRKRPVLTR